MRVRSAAGHPLLVALGGGSFHLPEDVAAELTRLVLELAQADVARVVLVAEGDDRPDVLRAHGGRAGAKT